jgi:hypothetical protein
MKGARIGKRCVIGQNVNVDGGTTIGDNVKIQNNVSIYTGVAIENDVFLGPSCVLTNVSNPRSQVNDTVAPRVQRWSECHDCVRHNNRTLCVCGRRLGGDQGCARLRVSGGESGAPGGLDEPPWTSVGSA